jgi:hypothetical protein
MAILPTSRDRVPYGPVRVHVTWMPAADPVSQHCRWSELNQQILYRFADLVEASIREWCVQSCPPKWHMQRKARSLHLLVELFGESVSRQRRMAPLPTRQMDEVCRLAPARDRRCQGSAHQFPIHGMCTDDYQAAGGPDWLGRLRHSLNQASLIFVSDSSERGK